MTKDVYRAYTLVAAFFTLLMLSPMVNADVQCNQDEGFIHAPYDVNEPNLDRELYIDYEKPSTVDQNVNVQSCGIRTLAEPPCQTLHPVLADLAPGEVLYLNHTLRPDQTCTITDVNGNAQTTEIWDVLVQRLFADDPAPVVGPNVINDAARWDDVDTEWTVIDAQTLVADNAGNAGSAYAKYQPATPFEEGTQYLVEFTVSGYAAGSMNALFNGGGEMSDAVEADGDYSFLLKAGPNPRVVFRGLNGFTANVSDISVSRYYSAGIGENLCPFNVVVICLP